MSDEPGDASPLVANAVCKEGTDVESVSCYSREKPCACRVVTEVVVVSCG